MRKTEQHRKIRHKQFMDKLILECKQTRLYQLAQEKNLGELKKFKTWELNTIIYIKVPYKIHQEVLFYPVKRSLIFSFAYENNHEIVKFLLKHALGNMGHAILGYAEAGREHQLVMNLIHQFPSRNHISQAMAGYLVSGRMLQLADLITCTSDIAIPTYAFRPEESGRIFEKRELTRLLMFINNEDLRHELIEKELKKDWNLTTYYTQEDLSKICDKAEKMRAILLELFKILMESIPLNQEMGWLIIGYRYSLIEAEEGPLFYQNWIEYKAARSQSSSPLSGSLLSWFTSCCSPPVNTLNLSTCIIC